MSNRWSKIIRTGESGVVLQVRRSVLSKGVGREVWGGGRGERKGASAGGWR